MNEIHPLGELLQEVMDRNGWSLRALSKRASDLGFAMSHSNFGRLKDEPVVSMKGETIKMLAQVLKVSESRVAEAVLGSMGVDAPAFPEQPKLKDVVRTTSEFSERDQRILLSVIDAMRDESGADGHAVNQDYQGNSRRQSVRAVAPAGDAGPGQKTGPRGYEAEDSLDQHGISQVSGPDAENIPVPPLEQLAAHPNLKSEREKWEEIHGERGEECQDLRTDG
ncbi:helix-turn-helix transcriptional regulator [Arthrobacter sp. JCM 19049]|uniref:helix-turn-helix domain-containing protein n=1 Tax=Arthrobacter sp. JCM 19049 TaxID=1460643 RepID=UPI0006D106FE|nr:helix-turn-helix transcriptional regulator [Arthrobacter sp. JCM 19049]